MDKRRIISDTECFVREQMHADATGHDWQHIHRVRNMALMLARAERADLFIVELAALLHDLDDYKLTGEASGALPKATEWLSKAGIESDICLKILDIINCLSYKGAGVDTPMKDIEGCVVQDADRLDAIGAVGIARTFAYGGAKGQAMYNPDIAPVQHQSFEEYRKSKAPTINHFYEKLLLLKDRMNTPTAKAIAEERHQFMLSFLAHFYNETGL